MTARFVGRILRSVIKSGINKKQEFYKT